jgi:hypothetical protein
MWNASSHFNGKAQIRVFQNRILKNIWTQERLSNKRLEKSNEELHNLYCPSDIINMIK